MEGGAAAVEVLVQNLIDVSKGEISLIRGLKKNANKLHNSLTLIHSYLDDAEKKLVTEEAVKTWLKQLDDVAFDAHNVLDELNYYDISKKMKSVRREKKKVLPSCFPSFNGYVRRRHMALRINKIYIRFESIKDDATKLGLHSRPAIAYALPQETDPQTLDPIFIGRDNDVADIVHKMLTTEEPLSVLPIVGMGGLGKTTLARKVFNHEKIKTHFGKQIWVHVSQYFDVMVLFKKILANLTSVNIVDESRVVLLEKIQEKLSNKTCLIVLDDIWNEDAQMWESFVNSLLGITSTKGNYILVTTRNKKVASIVHTLDIHDLNVLSTEDCLSIIKQKALSKAEDHIPLGFEGIANNIAKRCQGLPLAANIVGGLLHRTPKDEWISIVEGWLSNLQADDNDISKILRLSFDHLSPPSLKRCFAYCSIFLKGEVIDKQQLIELWMAQGFLQIDPKKGMEVEGDKFFYYLVQNSLLQVAKRDEYDNITHCSMHDLVHDLSCIVSKGVYQVQYIGSQNGGDESICSIPKECWRTLFFKGEVLSHTMFSDFKSLHTLTLMDCDLKELPSSINKLIHLRYLQISPRGIQDLPDSIGDLCHLQTLRADNDKISKLPTTVQYLINLRHLHLSYVTELPPNIGSLTCLQTLEYYCLGKEEGHGIGELGKLKDLQGKLHISNLEQMQDRKEAESAHLFEKPKLFNLVLEWSMSREGETNDVNVLEGLRPHPDLKRFEIIRFKGTTFPSNMVEGLNNLMEVLLKDCNECEEIPMMGQLPYLKSLSLSNLENVKSIRSSFKDSSCKERIVVFPVLRRLKLYGMPKLVEWIEIELAENEHPLEITVFPCLEDLDINECRELRIDPSQFSSCHKELNPGLHICGSLTHLCIDRLDELEYLPDWFLNNQKLLSLFIRKCGKLRELPDGLETLNSLKELVIVQCPNLKSIAYRSDGESQGLTSLESLSITQCNGLISLPCEMVESCAPSLRILTLWNLSSLINLPVIIDSLPKMSSLNSLFIWNVPKLISPPAPAVFHNLQSLDMKVAASDSSDSAKKGVDGMLQAASHSLVELHLSGMEDWDSLPHSLQHLNALSTLQLREFRIEELPEWFGNLTSLQTLEFRDCKELRSVGVTRCLKKLTQLWIKDCPILKSCIAQQIEDVSHIPNIWIDWQKFRKDGRTLDSYQVDDSDATSDATSDAIEDATSDTTSDSDATSNTTSDSDATSGATSDATSNTTSDATEDATSDTTSDAPEDATEDATKDDSVIV